MNPSESTSQPVVEAINWLLLGIGNIVLAVWDGTLTGLQWLIAGIDSLLNPILSPVLSVLNPACNWAGDLFYSLFGRFPPWIGLTVLSALAGIIALVAFRFTSNQKAIGRAKDDMKANLLALRLFKDELGVTFRCQVRLLWAIARLQRYMLFPLLVMLPPMMLLLAQVGLRHQWRPLQPGEQTNIKLTLANTHADVEGNSPSPPITLEPSPAIRDAVGVPGDGNIVWRFRAGEPGRYKLRFRTNDQTIEKELVISDAFERVSAVRSGPHWGTQLLHPIEKCLLNDSLVASIIIDYPHIDSWIYGASWWLLFFFVVSMATALIFKPLFKVRF